MKCVEFNIISKQYKTKEGKTFFAYKCTTKKGKLMTCKFIKDLASQAPQKEGIFRAICPMDGVSIDNNKQFPETWIRKIKSIEENVIVPNLDAVADAFEVLDEDLPW